MFGLVKALVVGVVKVFVWICQVTLAFWVFDKITSVIWPTDD